MYWPYRIMILYHGNIEKILANDTGWWVRQFNSHLFTALKGDSWTAAPCILWGVTIVFNALTHYCLINSHNIAYIWEISREEFHKVVMHQKRATFLPAAEQPWPIYSNYILSNVFKSIHKLIYVIYCTF